MGSSWGGCRGDRVAVSVERCAPGRKVLFQRKTTKTTKLRDLMVGLSWGVAQSMRAVEPNRYVWSFFDLELNSVRSSRKTEKQGFLDKISADGLA